MHSRAKSSPLVGIVQANSIAIMSVQLLHMCCLSIADPSYLNVDVILGARGIVKLNEGQSEVNDSRISRLHPRVLK